MTSRARAFLVLLVLFVTLSSSVGGCGGSSAPPSMAEAQAPAGEAAPAAVESMETESAPDSRYDADDAKPAEPPPPPAAPAPMAPGAAASMPAPTSAPPRAPASVGGGAPRSAVEAKAEEKGAAAAKPKSVAGSDEATTWKRAQSGAHAVRVEIGDREALPVRSVQAKVAIDGFMARVVLDIVVKNNRPETYEGTLKMRLPVGASPYYFAFGQDAMAIAGDAVPAFFPAERARGMGGEPAEIRSARQSAWQGVKEARMVPKEKAALAYTQTVRRNVDPALLEWAGPNVFNTRVFPLVGGKSHRIVLGYDVPLTRIGEDLEYSFDLPENVGSKAIDFAVAAPQGASVDVTPAVPAFSGPDKRFYRFDDPSGKTVTVRIKKPGAAHVVATDAATGPYFAADIAPQFPASSAAKGEENVLFLVDTSLSSNPDRFNVWLKLLDAILANNEDTIKHYNVLFFNIEQTFWKPRFVTNDAASRRELKTFAEGLALEGATDLGAALARATTAPGAPQFDVFLLSDGAATWGEPDAQMITKRLQKTPVRSVYAYQTGLAGTDVDALTLLTRETGGALFSVTGDAEVQKASTAHKSRPFRLVSARVSGGSDILFAGRPRFVFPGQTLRVAGRGTPDKDAAVELTLESGSGTQIVKAPLGQAIPSPLAIRGYGQIAVAQIEELAPATETMAKAYSIHFRVPGKTSSLLMLESEADYQRFGIVPEDFARTIKSASASRVVEDTLALSASALGNPKATFLRWIDGLPTTPGVALTVPPSFRQALNQMPEESFRVDAAPLAVKSRDKKSIPAPVLADLTAHKLDYDRMTTEAERRRASLGPADALKALSSLVEENPGDAVLARDVGVTAMSFGLPADAFHLFRRVAVARPYEPQTYRAMAQTLARLGRTDLAMAYFEVGLAGRWEARFGEFRKILALEYFDLLQRAARGDLKTHVPEYVKNRLPQVARETQLQSADLVVMITWNTDATDIDLHVTEPNGDVCYFGNRQTQLGGQLTMDVTQGYGPEMYVLKNATDGKYKMQAHYFASDRNRASTRTKVQVIVFEDFGMSAQKATEKVITLEYGKQKHDLLEIVRKAKPGQKPKPTLEMAGP
ncbi:DUF2135 domain-containing protein [Polyangium jinanense]|uniref:VIT domain-containing protein n=1 Tax=Polyangium jinanense TaxID=2829994 RepID=A0A9X3XDK2_9BACT|nr:hypothetical protein [Polyangium jinanense]MDC3959527.1 hypothetical protein [Polyangium jinanense]MDC3986126.1 hypothetical protein [Polyangium jinanense]